MLRLYCEDKLDRAKVTALATGLNTLLGFFRQEQELDVTARLAELEGKLEQLEAAQARRGGRT